MNDWRGDLRQVLEQGQSAVRVTVVGTRGSTPREAGATMIVTATETIGTIGGGQLEYQSTQAASQWLAKPNPVAPTSRKIVRKFTLGPDCGQCCGGIAELQFEEYQPTDIGKVERLPPISDNYFNVVIFGAGHVGSACAAVLSMLDTKINLVDSRLGFPGDRLPANVTAHSSSSPARFIEAAPAGSYFLVMTHDHGLDLEICARILQRPDVAFCGLIGSLSKRRRFEKRFRLLGLTENEITRLTCPIGIDEIAGKKPAEIAVAVSAQLQQLYEHGIGADARRGQWKRIS